MQYRLIPAIALDGPWLESLRRSVYQELFKATWGGWDERRHQRHFAACIEQGHISVVEVDGIRVGMIQIFDRPDRVEVGEIQVQPSHQSRGLGTRLLTDVVSAAHHRRKAVWLSVGLKNESAFRLYQRLGFRVASRSETHHHMACEPSA